jgi:hypothetical protein
MANLMGTVFFVVPLLVQILSLCWYWIFLLTFKYPDQHASCFAGAEAAATVRKTEVKICQQQLCD